jgi:hypothetical protein
LPLAAALLWRAGAPPATYLAMAAGFALMTIYNLYGNMSRAAADRPDPGSRVGQPGDRRGAAGRAKTRRGDRSGVRLRREFILLVNGVHGGLRDLANDLRCGMTTTAGFLGSRPALDGTVESSPALQVFAWLAFAAIVLPFPVGLLEEVFRYDEQTWWLVVVPWLVLTCASAAVLWRVVRRTEPEREKMISIHGLLVLLPPILVFLPFMSRRLATVCLCAFVLLLWAMDPKLERARIALTGDRPRAIGGLSGPCDGQSCIMHELSCVLHDVRCLSRGFAVQAKWHAPCFDAHGSRVPLPRRHLLRPLVGLRRSLRTALEGATP